MDKAGNAQKKIKISTSSKNESIQKKAKKTFK